MPGESVLVVDDSEARLDILSRLLRRNGFLPVVAKNGLAALSLPEQQKVSLVIINASLAQPDGTELAERLRRSVRGWYLPSLLLIPKENLQQGTEPALCGADGYISFPCSSNDLARRIDDILKEKKAKDYAEEQLRAATRKHIEQAVEGVAQDELSRKSAELVTDLSAGIVDLVEVESKKAVEKRVQQLVAEQLDSKIREIVEEVARVVISEESEDIVTRLVNSVVEQQVGQLLGKVETEEMPAVAERAVAKVVETMAREKVAEIAAETHAEVVQQIVGQIASSVEKSARAILPKVAKEILPQLNK